MVVIHSTIVAWCRISAATSVVRCAPLSQPDWQAGKGFLKAWVSMTLASQLAPMAKAAQTIRTHWQGILRWHRTGLNNGIMEGLNSLIQAAKRKARGYRNHRTFRLMAYLIAGKLDLMPKGGA